MGLFNFLKPKKNNYKVLHEIITELLNTFERKKRLVEIGVLIDLEFDSAMKERFMISTYVKKGVFSFLGKEFEDELQDIFNSEELNKEIILHTYNYLKNEQQKLKKLF